MNYINKVKIKGFWGDKTVLISFGQNENFLIGVNGSGKTTIINLIAAVVDVNFPTLDRTQFESITIYLSSTEKHTGKYRISVRKEENENTPYKNILYTIYKGNKLDFEVYLDDLVEERYFRHPDLDKMRLLNLRNERAHSKDLTGYLSRLFNVSWLSIHRINNNKKKRENRTHDSLVDQKLNQFNSNFNGYISELNRQAKNETDKFQKFIFLSLLSTETQSLLAQTLDKIELKKEKQDLAKVYSLFGLQMSDYQKDLKDYAKAFETAYSRFKDPDITITFGDADYLIGMKRIHSVIQEWKSLLEKQNEIFEYRDKFMSIINGLLQRKSLIINDRNELRVQTQSGKEFDLNFLSSGEKQLVIIFGETLLQKSEPHIFIADEPELSLHIEWQEKLVSSLKLLNPFAQLIFATHSPDIVSSFQKSVIQIENSIS